MGKITAATLQALKQKGEKFCCITAYDATFARLVAAAGAEIVLVGDSLGMVVQGHADTLPVSCDDMAYHTACAARAQTDALLITDMPFMSYATPGQALAGATRLMQAGAQMVKLEGGQWLCETISMLVERGIPVCAHLGLTPQSVNVLGGFRVQGRNDHDARNILADALAVQEANAALLVLECVPAALGADISAQLRIPVIGIGAGPDTDAQVLVLHDLLGLGSNPPRFVQDFMAGQDSVAGALRAFVAAVKAGRFPAPEHTYR